MSINSAYPDAPLVVNLLICTLLEKWRQMIVMFVGNMLHKRFPFGCHHLLEALLGGCGTPVEMVAYFVYPVSQFLTAILFAQVQHCL